MFPDIFREASILFFLNPFLVEIMNVFFHCFSKYLERGVFFFASVIHFIFHPTKKGLHNTVVIAVALTRH